MLRFNVSRSLLLSVLFWAGCTRVEENATVAEVPISALVASNSGEISAESAVNATASPIAESSVTRAENSQSVDPANVPAPVADDDGSFRVMSWNVEWFFDNEAGDNYSELAKEQTLSTRQQWDWKRDAVAKAIFQARPSVIGLQEIENKRVLFYLRRALARNHNVAYQELNIEGSDFFTEQDVGMMYRGDADTDTATSKLPVIDPIVVATYGRTRAQRKDKTLSDVTKQLIVTFDVVHGEAKEQVTIINVHLRAKEEGVEIRTRQARLVHAWVAERIKRGENVIVMGDINTDESVFPAQPGSDMFVLLGHETPPTDDDLIDLNVNLPTHERQTHLLKNKMFDRILVSPSLIEDDPARVDLVFSSMQRLKELCVQGEIDQPEQHWDHYWEIEDSARDISDHWPIMATFLWK